MAAYILYHNERFLIEPTNPVWQHYQSIGSLREYLLIASNRISITLHRRQSELQWLSITAKTLESSIELESLGCRLLLRDVYENITFPAETHAVQQA
jgi:Uma2 family endonuclease